MSIIGRAASALARGCQGQHPFKCHGGAVKKSRENLLAYFQHRVLQSASLLPSHDGRDRRCMRKETALCERCIKHGHHLPGTLGDLHSLRTELHVRGVGMYGYFKQRRHRISAKLQTSEALPTTSMFLLEETFQETHPTVSAWTGKVQSGQKAFPPSRVCAGMEGKALLGRIKGC